MSIGGVSNSTHMLPISILSPPIEKVPKKASDRSSCFSLFARRRLIHNQMERSRRNIQRERLQDLQNSIPLLRGRSVTNITVICKAKEYIDYLERELAKMKGNYEQREKYKDTDAKLSPVNTYGSEDQPRNFLLPEKLPSVLHSFIVVGGAQRRGQEIRLPPINTLFKIQESVG